MKSYISFVIRLGVALLCIGSSTLFGIEPRDVFQKEYNVKRDGTEYGQFVDFNYYSSVAEQDRKAIVWLPPRYNESQKYPVLYLLHGIGGDEREWLGGAPNEILSNLISESKAAKMIVVLPSVRVQHKSVSKPSGVFSIERFREFDSFLDDFQTALKPAIDAKFPTLQDRKHTAVAGLSMGGRSAIQLGVKLIDKIAFIGAFEPAPGVLPYNNEPGLFKKEELVFPAEFKSDTFLTIIRGTRDGVVGEWPSAYADAFKNNGIDPHFELLEGGHDFSVWQQSLYLFAQQIFRDSVKETPETLEKVDSSATPLTENAKVEYSAKEYGSITYSEADKKFSCDVKTRPETPWSVVIRYILPMEIQRGEKLTLRFKAKGIHAQTESGLAVVVPFCEQNAAPFTKSLYRSVEIGADWQDYAFSFTSAQSYKANECACGLFLGTQAQTLEIANVELVRGGNANDAPVQAFYPGAEPNAQWRKDALARIEKFRKGDLTVRVLDQDNRPIPNAVVSLRQTNSKFQWGTCVVANRLLDNSDNAEKYRQFVKDYCNVAVFENDLKWFSWQNVRNRQNIFKAIEWLNQNNIVVRGHCLIWPSWRNTPRDLRALQDSPDELRDRIKNHILEEATALSGKVVDWDVVNEPYDNTDIWKILGKDEIAEWFKTARQADPNVRLYINDYGILSGEGNDRRKQNFYFDLIKSLVDGGAPIGGIGLQGHFGSRATPPERIVEIIERFSQFGLPIAITEHDVDARDEEYHAQFTRDFLTAVFSCPSVDKFLVWGFWARAHWRPNAAYFTENWELTPAGKEFTTLVGKEWRTNENGVTDQNGVFKTRAFLGSYELEIETSRGVQKESFEVDDVGTNSVDFIVR